MSKQDSTTERNARIRKASLGGQSVAEIAAAENVSVATVRRALKDATAEALDRAEAAGKKAKKDRAADRAAKREAEKPALAAVPDVPEKPKAGPAKATAQRETITRDAALAFNARWTDEDRAALGALFDRIGAERFHRTASYVRVEDKGGTSLGNVNPARVDLTPTAVAKLDDVEPDKGGWGHVSLSTARKSA